MVYSLRSLATFEEDLSLVPSTHSSSREFSVLLWLPEHVCGAQIYMEAKHSYI